MPGNFNNNRKSSILLNEALSCKINVWTEFQFFNYGGLQYGIFMIANVTSHGYENEYHSLFFCIPGSVEKITENMWVFDVEEDKFVQREITYCPGLYKIFDEILVNAADNKQRDPKMDCIRVDIDP